MSLKTLADRLGLTTEAGNGMDRHLSGAYCSDMLSDVIANARPGNILITILNHQNVIGVALLIGIPAVLITGGRKPEDTAIAAANRENIAILTTSLNNFEASGKVYQMLYQKERA